MDHNHPKRLTREIREELKCEVVIVCENIFEHHGKSHEIILHFNQSSR